MDKSKVLEFFSGEVRKPVSFAELCTLLGVKKAGRNQLQSVVRELTRAGDLVRIKGGRLGLPRKMNLVVGELRCSPKGFGFVVPSRGQERDVFVRLPNMNGALHGDEVVARVEHRKRDGRLEGSIIRVLTRASPRMIGKFQVAAAGYLYVVPLEPKILTDVIIPEDSTKGAKEGDIVEVEIKHFPGETREAIGHVAAIIGRPEDASIDFELVVRRHQLPRAFPPAVRRAASAVVEEVSSEERAKRTDFRDDPIVTIDGESSRDFDDAVCVKRDGDGYEVQVHIADVAHYVLPGAPIDDEAKRRSTSVYFPDAVIPMLPEALSNGVCSLKPKVERLTISLIMSANSAGEVTDYKVVAGLIRSHARLTYQQVHAILADGDRPLRDEYRALLEPLELLEEFAKLVAIRRRERGSLDFDLPQNEIRLNVSGEMTGIRRGEHLVSHSIIEELMILANETVAGHFLTADVPSVYRVHEPPATADVDNLNITLLPLGYEVDALSPKSFRHVIEQTRGTPESRFVNTVTLRTMRLARYQPANIGHFGLASTAYTHFTSPIRRYPDLVIHRLLREGISGVILKKAQIEHRRSALDESMVEASRLERKAEDAEREYIERKKVRFMADKVGDEFDGTITGVASFGFFVELDEYFVEGLVHLTSLADDYYAFEEEKHRLIGENTGTVFQLASTVRVKVKHVDLLRRQVDFVIVAVETPKRRRTRSRRPQRVKRKRT